MTLQEKPQLTQLGHHVEQPATPAEAILETFANPHPNRNYVVRLTAPEFTSLCPVTGQPDFACIIVDYVPQNSLVESKSFKLFLGSFRNWRTFQEDCTVYIHNRLQEATQPQFLRVVALWYARGGITIDVTIQSGALPPQCTPLPLGRTAYRGGRD
ncbi:preQ(1) synthase [Desulfoferrobacter suflitae]|uniref:preQ(1) synthase n=1 Tax=Desulfoferrobacter suflitae TaxID=2865782 RepID=UPI0021646D56|nr:preQ(1) synthase [Desulfoferrobacter suflitae]MCK8603395.1 preQ(1) synthase [Desulfoferrobacter suflitae]